MGKILVEMDTNDKTFSVKLNGTALADVDSVSLYKRSSYGYYGEKPSNNDDDEDTCCFTISVREAEEDGMCKYTTIHANEKQVEQGKEMFDVEGFEGCVATVRTEKTEGRAHSVGVVVEPKLAEDINAYMQRK